MSAFLRTSALVPFSVAPQPAMTALSPRNRRCCSSIVVGRHIGRAFLSVHIQNNANTKFQTFPSICLCVFFVVLLYSRSTVENLGKTFVNVGKWTTCRTFDSEVVVCRYPIIMKCFLTSFLTIKILHFASTLLLMGK